MRYWKLLGLVLGMGLGVMPMALASSSDPFAGALPGRDTKPPEGTSGTDAAITAQQGAVTYAYPIELPPGRNGMAPRLALSYSSSAPLRGGLAVGWSLETPAIELDLKLAGRYRYAGELLALTPGDVGGGTRYRPVFDRGLTRIERTASGWIASTPDGVVRTFSGAAGSSDGATRWNLTSERDAFGNTVTYKWGVVATYDAHLDFVLQWIEYSSNLAAGIAAHARVVLTWQPTEVCPNATVPIGARFDHHFGRLRMFGAQRLLAITTAVHDGANGAWRDVRRYALRYEESELACAGLDRPALRYLSQIDVTGNPSGTPITAPPVKFQYGPTKRELSSTIVTGSASLGERGTNHGPEAQLIDFDGDGIQDQVRVTMPTQSGPRCRLLWRKGSFGGTFAAVEQETELPTAAWSGVADRPVDGDACTIDGQRAWRPTFTYGENHCEQGGVQVSYRFLDWDHDGDLDLVANTNAVGDSTACGDFECPQRLRTENDDDNQTNGSCPEGTTLEGHYGDGTSACSCDAGTQPNSTHSGCDPQCSFGSTYVEGSGCVSTCQSFDNCQGADPFPDGPGGLGGGAGAPCAGTVQDSTALRVYANDDGRFHPDDLTYHELATPIPLPPTSGTMAGPSSGMPTLPTFVDIDGDGWLDLIKPNNVLGFANRLDVHRGNGHGGFEPAQSWTLPMWSQEGNTLAYGQTPNIVSLTQAAQLVDLDGDGLLDIVFQRSSPVASEDGKLWVARNLQGSFAVPQPLGVRLPLGQQRIEMAANWSPPAPLTAGWRADEIQFSDIDRDGIPDLVKLATHSSVSGSSSSRTIYHVGDAAGFGLLPSSWEPIERLVRAINSRAWYRTSDFVDLTGDGRPDLVTFDIHGIATIHTDTASDPERLLVSIANGRGRVTRFTYGATTDPAVADAPVGRNEPRWVARTITVEPGAGQPSMTSTYDYGRPQFGRESTDDVEPRFFGFDRVTIDKSGQDGALSARTVQELSYAGDPTGHVVSEWTYLKSGRGLVPVRYETATWTVAPLLAGKAVFTYRDTHVSRVCDAGASEAACAVEAEHVATTSETWVPWVAWSGPIAYLNTQSIGELPTGEQRVTVRTFSVRFGQAPYAATDYRILPASEERRASPTGTPLSRTSIVYDVTGLPIDTYVYTTGLLVEASRTTRTFDATGNVVTVKRPNLVAAGSASVTTTIYDANRLFAVQTTNELGHVVYEKRDLGTGTLLRREGPRSRTWTPKCATPPCGTLMAYQPEEWSIDGFGRVTQHRVATDAPTGGYALAPIEWIAYGDGPASVRITEQLRDFATAAKLTTIDAFDGHGRVIRRTVMGPPQTYTTYDYDAGGALYQITSHDPSNDAARVAFTYRRDGLGRVTQLARPDGTQQRVIYSGLDVEVQDQASPTAGRDQGAAPLTRSEHDPFGRLVAVHEPDATGDHVTHYEYDAADRMTRIVDADGNVTTLAYDRAGHRTSLTRGDRTWFYGYDRDGNLGVETSPLPAGELDPTKYMTLTEYDQLDRPRVHTPAPRELSATRRAALGIGPMTTTYDTGPNSIGLPSRLTLPFGTIDYLYDVHGHVARETRSITIAQGATVNASQWVARSYDALGAPTQVVWSNGTRWRTSYDARGLVAGVAWTEPGGTERSLASYTRSLAGPPRSRTNAYGQQREWTYDMLGRVSYDRVSMTTTFAERTYGYDDFGRLGTVHGTVAGDNVEADYDYDGRGRLANAIGPGDYSASLAYSPGGNITHANIAGATDAPARDVSYEYGARDPHAVDRLVDPSGNAVAELTYDQSGNLVRRVVAGSTWLLTPDGEDRIREVTGPSGTEVYYFGPGGERLVAIGPDGVKWWFGESETLFSHAGALVRRWHHVGAGEPLARIEDGVAVELQYADALQNLMVTLSPSGSIVSSFVYGGFGEVVASSGEADHRRQFNGKEADATSGLRHYGVRSYDPVLLRWTAADPKYRFAPDAAWVEPQRANLYAFSMNDPLRYYDPDGRDAKDESKGTIYVVTGLRVFGQNGPARERALDATLDYARAAGYTVKEVNFAVLKDAVAAFEDPSTVAVVLDEHGNAGHIGFFGNDHEGGSQQITPEAAGKLNVSPKLKATVFVSCKVVRSLWEKSDWEDALGGKVYGYGKSISWKDVEEDDLIATALEKNLPGVWAEHLKKIVAGDTARPARKP